MQNAYICNVRTTNGRIWPWNSMKLQYKIKTFLGILVFSSLSVGGQAQDLIARQAPVDRRVKAADSVSLKHLLNVEREEEIRGLYPDFNNVSVHNYKGVEFPDSFRIDMRNFCMPTPSRRVTSGYGYRAAFRRVHKGLDIKVYIGDTIKAAFSGKVRIVDYEPGGYGNYVVIRHNNGLETVYGHLSKQLVEENQAVKAGESIGLGGNTGISTGSHLHFECLFLGKAIDPALLFDFENQDIVADYYVFHNEAASSENNKQSVLNGKANEDGSESAVVDVKYRKVKKGDSLYSIATELGTTVERLCSLNRISKRQRLRPGQILRYAE